ncbi:MAG: reverse transcriptase/maturase family protein [Bifidobacteriaceae bacterium]|nr:reverse transcriptase/maturase family protein [Bifidobacteriaceae bacterium]
MQARASTRESLPAGVKWFAANCEENIARLRIGLTDGSYRPSRLTRVDITKPVGGTRVLDVPAVSDRAVERALLDILTPHVDPFLSPAAFAYRPGLGVADAIQRVAEFRELGMSWILRSDIEDCFPSIRREVAVERLMFVLPDQCLRSLLEMLLARRTATKRGLREVTGLAQGTPLSPMLCNVVLGLVDDALLDRGFGATRFADDVVVACASQQDATEALAVTNETLGGIGMSLASDKTEIVSFEEGFCFLG